VKVCLITTGQPSSNPRLVKEADALVEAGYEVHVVAAHWADWATEMDRGLLTSRPWKMTFIDWRREQSPWLFHWSRARHWAARQASRVTTMDGRLAAAALARVGPEVRRAALRVPADLFIAHNLGALPAACAAAAAHSAKVGFDAEDFHSGQLSRPADAHAAAFTRDAERRLLVRAAYVTAASAGIAEAYRDLCGIPLPTCILNVFPLQDRPSRLRPDVIRDPIRLYWFSQTIGPNRGLEDAVRAIGLLRAYPIELHVRGRWQDGYHDRLRQLAADNGVAQERLVSHPLAAPDDMVRLAAGYDVGLALEPPVSANNDLLLSNKIFTYLLAGNAVIATRTTGQYRLMQDLHGAAAWCEPGKPGSLASALLPWLRQRNTLAQARSVAWDLGEERFNWDREKKRFVDVVQGVLGVARVTEPA
jgi:glycosyltransferase involved in cell wall biosynthesis